jgi:hypothetical protein
LLDLSNIYWLAWLRFRRHGDLPYTRQ